VADGGTIYNTVTLDHADCLITGSVCADDDTNIVYIPPSPISSPPDTGLARLKGLAYPIVIIALTGLLSLAAIFATVRKINRLKN
jgi:hypothetical protein